MSNIFDATLSSIERDRGISRADDNANEAWKAFIWQMVVETAREHQQFTTDEVFERADQYPDAPKQHEKRAMGAIMRRAFKEQIVEPANVMPRKSRRVSLHRSPITV